MRIRTEIWERLARRGHFIFEAKARIGAKDYTAISAPIIDRPLMTQPLSVGNCISASLHLSILTDDSIPKAAPVTILGRLCEGDQLSEWKEFGTFFIDQRDTSYEGLLTLDGYDALLKANQDYLGEQDSSLWPKPMKSVVEEIAYRIGVGIDERTKIRTGGDYVVPKPEGLTMLQVLGYIGACHGGNWTITEENLLRLVPLASAPPETSFIVDEEWNIISTADGDRLLHAEQPEAGNPLPSPAGEQPDSVIPRRYYITDQHGNRIATHSGGFLVWDSEDGHVYPEGTFRVPVVCGQLTKGEALTISRVILHKSGDEAYTAGDNSGATLQIDSNPYATQTICDDLYASYHGLIDRPFTATKTLYDPAAELGDPVKIGGRVNSVLFGARLTLDHNFRADIQAPNSEELSAEYPYLSETKSLRQTTQELSAAVSQAATELQSKVSSSELQAEITRASSAEQALSTAIGAEESRAKAAEQALSGALPGIMSAASAQADGASGLVPKPKQGEQNKVLCGNTSWKALDAADISAQTQIGGEQQSTVADALRALLTQYASDLQSICARLDALENN